jgi:hypothetical protein
MAFYSETDERIKPYVGDIVTGSIRPRWWVRIMARIADLLWRMGLIRASWVVADSCIWLQKKGKRGG